MGTYTTNYNLFLPTIGEQGWGELVNGNFTTIDATMKGLDTRVTTLEAGEFETINCTGTITANVFVGGIGSFSKINGNLYVPWTTTSTQTNVVLTPAHSGTTTDTNGWRTVLTFNVPHPSQPSFGINLESGISTFYSSVTCTNMYAGDNAVYQLRVNGITYPTHRGPGVSPWAGFTENNVMFNIGDNVVEFYQNIRQTGSTPKITTAAVYIAPILD